MSYGLQDRDTVKQQDSPDQDLGPGWISLLYHRVSPDPNVIFSTVLTYSSKSFLVNLMGVVSLNCEPLSLGGSESDLWFPGIQCPQPQPSYVRYWSGARHSNLNGQPFISVAAQAFGDWSASRLQRAEQSDT